MKKEYLNKWYKLDNAAKIFSLDDKNNTNIFRYSVILYENVDKDKLKEAVEKTLNNYQNFKVKIGIGVFWNYLEYNNKEIVIEEEKEIPCQHIDFKKNNDYLFKVTYYNKKINLDIFHILTDGTGGIIFLKSIIYNYLSLKHNISFKENIDNINYEDQYVKNYDKNIIVNRNHNKAYQLPGKINKSINNTYHYIINLKRLKKVCKKYKVTITEYLTALYVYSIYLSMYDKKEDIIISVPIDLRNYYKVNTLSNFFVCMNINPKILENDLKTFDDILIKINEEFKEKLKVNNVNYYLARDVKLGRNVPIRLIPLFVKKVIIKCLSKSISKNSTSTLSNVGIIDIDNEYKKYINNILALVIPDRNQKIKCTICSYNDKLNITINSNIEDFTFQKTFYKLLQDEIKDVNIESNNLE